MVEKPRASKDGNEFHETWAARRSLELLMPRDRLVGIAVEGFSSEDDEQLSAEAVEIADLVLYYGDDCRFVSAHRVEVSQFKYSVARHNKGFVASDAKKTLLKFAAVDQEHYDVHGSSATQRKLRFSIVTNRPIDPSFALAIEKLARGERSALPKVVEQANQIADACGLSQSRLKSLLSRLELRGSMGSLSALKADIATRIVDWSVNTDYVASGRLGSVKALLRTKAGTEGQGRNLVRLEDLLNALGVPDKGALLPAPASFIPVQSVLSRKAVEDQVIARLQVESTIVIHAPGGVGKTVFMQALGKRLSETGEVILFDCFGGGNYRSVEDARHLPGRGLLHIVNVLASRGLCDPIIPGPITNGDMFIAARRRFEQTVATLRKAEPSARLCIMLDAADNAAQQASDQREKAFPTQLLETFKQLGVPVGVALIVSCRPERLDMTIGQSKPSRYALPAFSRDETELYLASRIASVPSNRVDIAHLRSGGNARVLAHLVEQWDELIVNPSAGQSPIFVEELIARRLERALDYVERQGLSNIGRAFLCGLTVLPPPVPISEYASSLGVPTESIESSAADLAPLLDRTPLGIVFRDEPTETYVRNKYGDDPFLLASIAKQLNAAQGRSWYAARSLPRLLGLIGDADSALALAFSEEMPSSVLSDVGKRAIRTHRLTTAVGMMTQLDRKSDAIKLLVELATVAANSDNLDALIASHPDMVAASNDREALRRLFELSAPWPGARHARLAITHRLLGNDLDASVNAQQCRGWLRWYLNQTGDSSSVKAPSIIEAAAWPIHLASQGRHHDAFAALSVWRPWFAYLVARDLIRISLSHLGIPRDHFCVALTSGASQSLGLYAAALDMGVGDSMQEQRALVRRLATACKKAARDKFFKGEKTDLLIDALLQAAGVALRLKMRRDACQILEQTCIARPSVYAFRQEWADGDLHRWLRYAALLAVAQGRQPTLVDIMCSEARETLPKVVRRNYSANEIAERVKAKALAASRSQSAKGASGTSDWYEIGQTLTGSTASLLTFCVDFAAEVISPSTATSSPLLSALDATRDSRSYMLHLSARVRRSVLVEMVLFAFQLGGPHSQPYARRMVESITKELDSPISTGLRWLEVLTQRPTTSMVGPELLPWLERQLTHESDASRRSNLLAETAKALWPVSPDDSRLYFRRAMQQLDSLGSADYAMVMALLPLVSHLKTHRLSPECFQRLSNLCEMIFQGEPSRFPWVEFARAAVAARGRQALSQIGRWAARDEVDWGYSAPPLIGRLVEAGQLSPDNALVLLSLDEFHEAYAFSWGSMVKALIASAPHRADELTLQAIRQCERDDRSASSRYSLEQILSVAATKLPVGSNALAYLQERVTLLQHLPRPLADTSYSGLPEDPRSKRQRVRKKVGEMEAVAALSRQCQPLSLSDVAGAIATLDEIDRSRDTLWRFFGDLADRVPHRQRAEFIDLLTRVDGLTLDARLDLVEGAFKRWESTSPSLRASREAIFDRFILVHGAELMAQQWGFTNSILRLAAIGALSKEQAALRLSRNLSQLAVVTNAQHWIWLATLVAEEQDGSAVLDAVDRLLTGPAMSMAAEYGEGQHRPEHDADSAEDEWVANLVWSRLGSSDAFDRWRAAHVFRALAARSNPAAIDALVNLFDHIDGGPGFPRNVKFPVWDARLWLMMGMARAAKESPALIERHLTMLMSVAFAGSPHVLLQAFARQALQAVRLGGAENLKLSEQLAANDPVAKPRVKYPHASTDPWGNATRRKLVGQFSLDYDFRKYDVPALGRAFGISAADIAVLVEEKASSLDPAAQSMHEGGRPGSRGSRSGTDGRFRTYGGHLGWHSLFLVAGQLLATRPPSVADRWGEDPWQSFINRYGVSDRGGLWLSDGTDLFPPAANYNLARSIDGRVELSSDLEALVGLAGIVDGKPLDEIVVDGAWRCNDGVEVRVRTALVPNAETLRACRQLAGRPYHDLWLPQQRSEDDEDDQGTHFKPWLQSPSVELRCDEYDPYCTTSALSRSRPASAFRAWAGVSAADPFGRSWTDAEGRQIMRAFAWGERRGYGEHEANIADQALLCRTDSLKDFLASVQCHLAVLIRIEKHTEQHAQDPIRFRCNGAVAAIGSDGSLVFSAPTRKVRRTGF